MGGGRKQRQANPAKANITGGLEIKTDRYPPLVTITITAGPVTPAQRQAWKTLWARLVAEAKQREGER